MRNNATELRSEAIKFCLTPNAKRLAHVVANRRTEEERERTGNPGARVTVADVCREALECFLDGQPEGAELKLEADGQTDLEAAIKRKGTR